MKKILNEEALLKVNAGGSAADQKIAEKGKGYSVVEEEDLLNEIKLPDFDLE